MTAFPNALAVGSVAAVSSADVASRLATAAATFVDEQSTGSGQVFGFGRSGDWSSTRGVLVVSSSVLAAATGISAAPPGFCALYRGTKYAGDVQVKTTLGTATGAGVWLNATEVTGIFTASGYCAEVLSDGLTVKVWRVAGGFGPATAIATAALAAKCAAGDTWLAAINAAGVLVCGCLHSNGVYEEAVRVNVNSFAPVLSSGQAGLGVQTANEMAEGGTFTRLEITQPTII